MSKGAGKKGEQDKQLASLLEEELGTKKQPEKIHLGDTAALKRALDDAAAEVRTAAHARRTVQLPTTDQMISMLPRHAHLNLPLQALREGGYDMSNTYMDIKIALGGLA